MWIFYIIRKHVSHRIKWLRLYNQIKAQVKNKLMVVLSYMHLYAIKL